MIIEEVNEISDDSFEPQNKAVVIFKFGKGIALCVDLDDELQELVCGYCGESGFSLEHIDHEQQPDGIYIGEFRHVDDGPSDWQDGSRETILGMHNFQPITEQQWADFLDGMFPWGSV